MPPEIYHIPVAIAGAGVVGLSIAKELSSMKEFREGVFLFEKNKQLGQEQSGRNSGVIHAGIYYKPGSLKARLCVEGNQRIKEYAQNHEVPWAAAGKLIVATNHEEEKDLEFYLERALANGVPGIEIISSAEAREKLNNNHLNCTAALYSPSTGVIDAGSYLQSLKREFLRNNPDNLLLENEIKKVRPGKEYVEFEVLRRREGIVETYRADRFINAAGLYADRLAKQINPDFPYQMGSVGGDYCVYSINRPEIDIKGVNVYPVLNKYQFRGRTKTFPGIHLTPIFTFDSSGCSSLGKQVLVGPTPNLNRKRNDYSRESSLPKEHFLEQVVKYFPKLTLDDLELADPGNMAVLKDYDDFVVEKDEKYPNCIQIVGSGSPFLTASAAVGSYVRKMLV